jgi:hypothetical protein
MAKAATVAIKSKPATPDDKIVAAGRQLFDAKARKDKLETELSEINLVIKELATVTLAKLMEDAGVEKTTLAGLGTIYLSNDFFASVNKDDRPALYTWMRDNGHGDIITDWVFPQTLTAFCKEMTQKNLALPDCVKSVFIPTVRTRKS